MQTTIFRMLRLSVEIIDTTLSAVTLLVAPSYSRMLNAIFADVKNLPTNLCKGRNNGCRKITHRSDSAVVLVDAKGGITKSSQNDLPLPISSVGNHPQATRNFSTMICHVDAWLSFDPVPHGRCSQIVHGYTWVTWVFLLEPLSHLSPWSHTYDFEFFVLHECCF